MLTAKQKVTLVIISFFASLVLLEIGIRTIDAVRGYGFFSDHRNQLAIEDAGIVPFRTFGPPLYKTEGGTRYISSAHGELFPLKREPGVIRIVCLGGSTSENRYAMEQTGINYPLVLQKLLRERLGNDKIEVINVAHSAYATNHSLILLAFDVISWNPDIVILSHNANDLFASYWPNFTFDYSNKYSAGFYRGPNLREHYSLTNVLFQHSNLYWIVKSRISRYLKEGSEIVREAQGETPLPEAMDVFERNLTSFIALATVNGIKPVLGTQALHESEENFVKHMRAKPYNDKVRYPLHREFVAHHRQFNSIIAKVAHDNGALLVNNNERLDNKDEFFFDFAHYTTEGVRELAANYADALLGSQMVR